MQIGKLMFFFKIVNQEKKSESVIHFLTYWRKTWFSFFYKKVSELDRLIAPSDKIDKVSKFYNSLSFGAKQKALRQIFLA